MVQKSPRREESFRFENRQKIWPDSRLLPSQPACRKRSSKRASSSPTPGAMAFSGAMATARSAARTRRGLSRGRAACQAPSHPRLPVCSKPARHPRISARRMRVSGLSHRHIQNLDVASFAVEVEKAWEQEDVVPYFEPVFFEVGEKAVERLFPHAPLARDLSSEAHAGAEIEPLHAGARIVAQVMLFLCGDGVDIVGIDRRAFVEQIASPDDSWRSSSRPGSS